MIEGFKSLDNFILESITNKSIDWNVYSKTNKELQAALEIMKIIDKAGYESLIVGGFVRDIIMNKKSNDIDIATNMPQEEIKKHFDTIDVGESFGVNIVKYKGFTMEVAQYRKDIYSDLMKGKGADSVAIVSDFSEDAARRDFTINSLGIDLNGNIVDHHGGIDDIEKNVITTVGDPELRFQEDVVRTLRGVRFASRLDFNIDQKTIDAIKKFAPEIGKVSAERITKELNKMAEQEGPKFAQALEMLDSVGLLNFILPEVVELKTKPHTPEQHPEGNAWEHTLAALRSNNLKDPIINLSILFHDIGKLKTHSTDESGVHRYFGHAKESASLVEEIGKRLKMSNSEIEAMKFAALNHMKIHDFMKLSNKKVIDLMNDPNWEVLISVALADNKARGELFNEQEWEEIQNRIEQLRKSFSGAKSYEAIKKLVNGNFVMSVRPDIKPGPILGDIIRNTLSWVIDNNIDINKDIDLIVKHIKES
jgi:tRNA nucleotidyltransferase/poly(A) polymerase